MMMKKTARYFLIPLLLLSMLLCDGALAGLDFGHDPDELLFTLRRDGTYSVTAGEDKNRASVEIPSTYKGKPVTAVESDAFRQCCALTSITIPPSIKSVGQRAFMACLNLKEVHISDIDAWRTVRFEDEYSNPMRFATDIYLNGNVITEVTLPQDLTEILPYTFYGFRQLRSVTIPSTVNRIGVCAFSYCESLTSVVIPPNVTELGAGAFGGCDRLTHVTLPPTLTEIGKYVFWDCSALASITLPPNLREIGDRAFSGTALSAVEIPAGVAKIGMSAFSYCHALRNVAFAENGALVYIGQYAFSQCDSLTSISLPQGLKILSAGAFGGSALITVTLPSSVVMVGEGAFVWCENLDTVTFEKGVRLGVFNRNAFAKCNALVAVYYGGSAQEWERALVTPYTMDSVFDPPMYYYSETPPQTAGNYWYYNGANEITLWPPVIN